MLIIKRYCTLWYAKEGHDLMVTIKHFALNEQEVNARSGVMVWANEQALRK